MQRVSSLATNRLATLCWTRSASVSSRRAISSSVSLSQRGWCIDGGVKSPSLFSSAITSPYNRLAMFNQFNRYLASYPSHIKVRLPALSPTMEQGTLAKWAKKEGDHVVEGDLIAEIETDKATMGLEASEEGYLAKIIVAEKTKDIPLKSLLCIMVPNKADVAAFADFKASDDQDAAAPAAPAPPKPAAAPVAAAPSTPPPPPPPAPAQQQQIHHQAPRAAGARVFATPLAKRLAAERHIDLSLVTPTGPDNQVRAQDIINYASSTPSAAPARSHAAPGSASSAGDYEDIPVNNYRAVTAKRLTQSKQTIPHYYLTVDLEIDQALKIRKDLNEQFAKTGEADGNNLKLSVNDFVIKAAALACKKVPEANSAWMDTHIRKHNTVDVCVAVATENGLITPIVFNADKKGLSSISFDVGVLAKKARDNKLQPHEFQGGTFTISNLGMFGIKSFAAVINPPQSCILAVGGTEKRVVPTDEKGTGVATYLTVTLSCDHRVVDGAVGAKWLQYFKKYMENPASMLL